MVDWSFGFKSQGVLCRGEDRLLILVGFIANYSSSALQPNFIFFQVDSVAVFILM